MKKKTEHILTKGEHDKFRLMFPEVKSRCPACYISQFVEKKVFDKLLSAFKCDGNPMNPEYYISCRDFNKLRSDYKLRKKKREKQNG